MKIYYYLLLAFIEYIITLVICQIIKIEKYDYVSIHYVELKFSDDENNYNGLNILIKLFLPTILLIITSGLLYKLDLITLNSNIFMVTIIYHIIDFLFKFVILKRKYLIDIKEEIETSIFSIMLSLFMYMIFISKTKDIFIDFEELKNGIWFAIISFILGLILKTIYEKSEIKKEEKNLRINKYISNMYKSLKKKYGSLIKEKDKKIESLIYAIMIFENFNRPYIFRLLEYIKLFITGEATVGVMQVKTNKYINNKQSILLGIEKIKSNLGRSKKITETKLNKILYDYNPSKKYIDQVTYIYNYILENIDSKN